MNICKHGEVKPQRDICIHCLVEDVLSRDRESTRNKIQALNDFLDRAMDATKKLGHEADKYQRLYEDECRKVRELQHVISQFDLFVGVYEGSVLDKKRAEELIRKYGTMGGYPIDFSGKKPE